MGVTDGDIAEQVAGLREEFAELERVCERLAEFINAERARKSELEKQVAEAAN